MDNLIAYDQFVVAFQGVVDEKREAIIDAESHYVYTVKALRGGD
jgi:hypothetical protein